MCVCVCVCVRVCVFKILFQNASSQFCCISPLSVPETEAAIIYATAEFPSLVIMWLLAEFMYLAVTVTLGNIIVSSSGLPR